MAVAVVADRLIDGSGRDPINDAAVVCDGARIVAAGSRREVSIPAGIEVIEGDDLTVLPGLMDMHVHVGMQSGMNLTRILMTPPTLDLLHCVPNAGDTLRAGVTTIRDAGLTPAGVKLAVERGFFPGPRMAVSVQIISQTGGHADPYMPCGMHLPLGGDGLPDVPPGVVDSPDAMRHTVRAILRAGADWIKLCTSGGVLSPGDLPDTPQLTVEEIAVAVHEAGIHGKGCMAHAMSAQGIKNALRAGVISIEHGCLLDEEAIAMMRERGAYLVPTLVAPHDVIATVQDDPGAIPEAMIDKARRLIERHRQSFRAAVEGGVRIAMGTDSGVGSHGRNLRELRLMVENGMTPMQAIVATTRTAAELLKRDTQLGTLEPGRVADLVAVAGDPLADIGILAEPARIRLVIKDGAVVHEAPAAGVPAGVQSAAQRRD
ncbi:MAG: amidohydrolase family protein [Chloroflexi bacterium]|nr:MAG: amidohydrolase family protein [Chloroflexota bacterium]